MKAETLMDVLVRVSEMEVADLLRDAFGYRGEVRVVCHSTADVLRVAGLIERVRAEQRRGGEGEGEGQWPA